jgi:hypothetical protein
MTDLDGLNDAELAQREHEALLEMVSAHDALDALFTTKGTAELSGRRDPELNIDIAEFVAAQRRWYDAVKKLNSIRRKRRIPELPVGPEPQQQTPTPAPSP